MSSLEKLEALLDEMGVWYEREDKDEEILISIPGITEGYKNRGGGSMTQTIIVFDIHGNCREYWA